MKQTLGLFAFVFFGANILLGCNTPEFRAPLPKISGSGSSTPSLQPFDPFGPGGPDTNPGTTPTPEPSPTPSPSPSPSPTPEPGPHANPIFIINDGRTCAGITDVDSDGVNDFLVGNSLGNVTTTLSAGTTRVYSGASGTILGSPIGGVEGSDLGFSLSYAGDVNGDGQGDFLVGDPSFNYNGVENMGRVMLYTMVNGEPTELETLYGNFDYEHVGWSVAEIGDLDGDGRSEMLFSEEAGDLSTWNYQPGRVYIFSYDEYYPMAAILNPGGFIDPFLDDWFGHSVTGLGDINDDDIPDFVVSAPFYEYPGDPSDYDSGAVYFYSGADFALIDSIRHLYPETYFGWSIANAGDIDGDGVNELIVGAPNDGYIRNGKVYVYSGANRELIREWIGQPNERLGWSVDGAGDTNGDSIPDLIVGCYPDNGTQVVNGSGRAKVFSGGISGQVLYEYEGQKLFGKLGQDVCGLGDLNGDGLANFGITETGMTYPNLPFNNGRVWVY